MKSFSSVVKDIKDREMSTSIIDEHNYTVTIPVATIPDLYILLEFGDKRLFSRQLSQIKLLYTGERTDLYFDLEYENAKKIKIIRDCINGVIVRGVPPVTQIMTWSLEKIRDFDPAKLFIKASIITNVVETNIEHIVTSNSWVGMMDYAKCKTTLSHTTVDFDDKEEEVFFRVPYGDENINLVVDFDKGDVDMKAIVLPSGTGKQIGFRMHTPKYKKFYSMSYNKTKHMCNGSKQIVRQSQLDDLPFGVYFRDMGMDIFELVDGRIVSLKDACGF